MGCGGREGGTKGLKSKEKRKGRRSGGWIYSYTGRQEPRINVSND